MNSRTAILERIRTALADRPVPGGIPRAYRGMDEQTAFDHVAMLAERVSDYRARVHQVDEDALPRTIEDVLAARNIRSLIVPAGVPNAWLERISGRIVNDEPVIGAPELDRIDGVITTCACAIALTGTIVLDAGAGQGRRALSLVPDYHLVIVRAEQIVAGVPDAVALLDPSRPQTWISGPSATSDIELQRVEGVHGPRTLEVLISL